jgi:hypothetical protein
MENTFINTIQVLLLLGSSPDPQRRPVQLGFAQRDLRLRRKVLKKMDFVKCMCIGMSVDKIDLNELKLKYWIYSKVCHCTDV